MLQVIYNNEKKIYSDTRFAYTDLTHKPAASGSPENQWHLLLQAGHHS